jgi:hypothetical protein
MAEVENILLPMQRELMERARLEAAISGQTVEEILVAWTERGSTSSEAAGALPHGYFEVWSPTLEGKVMSQLEHLLEEDRHKYDEPE